MPDFHKIDKGTLVHVMGRLRTQRFEGNDGVEKQIYEILANRIEIENCPEGTQPAFGI